MQACCLEQYEAYRELIKLKPDEIEKWTPIGEAQERMEATSNYLRNQLVNDLTLLRGEATTTTDKGMTMEDSTRNPSAVTAKTDAEDVSTVGATSTIGSPRKVVRTIQKVRFY